jgi:hypothetical protein
MTLPHTAPPIAPKGNDINSSSEGRLSFSFMFCFDNSQHNAIHQQRGPQTIELKKVAGLSPVCWMFLCTPGTGVNLWGGSPLSNGFLEKEGLVSIRTLWIQIHYPAKAR